MDESFKLKLEESGADVQSTLRRFMGKEELYLKFLKKFPEDQNYQKLGESLEAGNYEEAFRNAHTLKGVAANLGLVPVQTVVSGLVEELRNKSAEEVDVPKANAMLQDLKKESDIPAGRMGRHGLPNTIRHGTPAMNLYTLIVCVRRRRTWGCDDGT